MNQAVKRWGLNYVPLKGGAPSPLPPSPTHSKVSGECSKPEDSEQSLQKKIKILQENLSAADILNNNLSKKLGKITSAYTEIHTHFVSMQSAVDEQRATIAGLQVIVDQGY